MHGAPHTFSSWFNTNCVEAPIAGTIGTTANPSGTPYSTGTGVFSPKVSFFLPSNTNFDTALFKNITFENRYVLQLRVETYNTFNHTQFNGVNNTATFQNANQLTTNPQTATNFGTMSSAQNPRYMQLALRLTF